MSFILRHAREAALAGVAVYICEYFGWTLELPDTVPDLLVWVATFSVSVNILSFMGFGRRGVRSDSFASAYQSRTYGGHTPRRGWFAWMTSVAMRGFVMPLVAAAIATAATPRIMDALTESGVVEA